MIQSNSTIVKITFITLCILLLLFFHGTESQFTTCQGSTYTAAVSNCPDQGSQRRSSGGNVTVKVISAKNMPNKDSTGPPAGISDPYVKFKVGGITAQTREIRDNLNPVWNEFVSLGFLGSGTLVEVEVWDKDGGLEFADDLLYSGNFRVPFCSAFSANVTTKQCENPFDCRSDDSLWQNPTRKMCVESGTIKFNDFYRCEAPRGVCLFLEVYIVPFQMEVEYTYPTALVQTPQLTVAGPINSARWTKTFGFPFIGLSTRLDMLIPEATSLFGALMFQMSNADRFFGAFNAIKFFASTNFPATIYVCRNVDDNELGVPDWLQKDFDGRFVDINQLKIQSVDAYFGCYQKEVLGTKKNEWDGVIEGEIEFRTNTLRGKDTGTTAEQNFYDYNYIVLATPRVVADREDTVEIIYDSAQFLNNIFSYGVFWAWLMYAIAKFLEKIDFRIDRITNFAATRVLTGDDRSVLAALTLNLNKSPCNIQYRAHLFHLKNIFTFIFALPFLLLFSWGITCSATVRPRTLGIAITFVGSAMVFLWYGFRLWERCNWRLSTIALTSLLLSVASLMLFLLVSLFLDPAVLKYDRSIDFAALSLIFGTLNCIPGLLLVFRQDRSHKIHTEVVIEKLAEAIVQVKSGENNGNQDPAIYLNNPANKKINKMIHALLGEKYSINPKVPALQYSTVIHEFTETYNTAMHNQKPSTAVVVANNSPAKPNNTENNNNNNNNNNSNNNGNNTNPQESSEEEDETALEKLQKMLTFDRKIYGFSLIILFIYFLIAFFRTTSGSLAFLNILALILLDIIHLSMSKGENNWSPGFKTCLLVLGRLLICGSPASLWVLNYSACYLLYSITLIHEAINIILPKITARKAGEIVFGGGESFNALRDSLKTKDIAGGIGFSLAALIMCFSSVLIVSAFMPSGDDVDADARLLVPTIGVLGARWPIYVFGIISLMLSLIIGMAMASQRAHELDLNDLLQGWAREAYLFRKEVKLPLVLGLGTEVSILLSGLLIYAITKSAAILAGAVFLPVIFLCHGYALRVWMKNDYELVVWPRPKKPLEELSLTASAMGKSAAGQKSHLTPEEEALLAGPSVSPSGDLDVAFNMIESMFGGVKANKNLLKNRQNHHLKQLRGANKHLRVQDIEDGEGDSEPETEQDDGEPENDQDDESQLALLNKSSQNLSASATGNKEVTLKGFQLPPLKATGNKLEGSAGAGGTIKMPPLPLKSVLRRKRQALGIKTQGVLPVVKDLRVRESAVSADQFGNKTEDVLNINDPWAAFEMQEENAGVKKKKIGVGVTTAKKRRETNENLMKTLRRAWKKNPYLQYVSGLFASLWQFLSRHTQVTPAKYAPSWDEEEGTAGAGGESAPELPNEDENAGVLVLPTAEEEDEEIQQNEQTTKANARSSKASKKDHHEDIESQPVKAEMKIKKSGKEHSSSKLIRNEDFDDEEEVDVDQLTFWQAFFQGYLNEDEYTVMYAWFAGFFFIMLFGLTLAATVSPAYLGFVIWIVWWELLLVYVPVYRYFHVYDFDMNARNMFRCCGVVHFLFCVCMFAVLMRGDQGRVGSLWIMNYFFYYPVFSFILFGAIKWVDSDFLLPVMDKNGDGKVSLMEFLEYSKTFPALFIAVALFVWQLYVWINATTGIVFILLLLACSIGYFYIKDWAANGKFLSPELVNMGNVMLNLTIFISFMVALFGISNPIFAVSVFLFSLSLKLILRVLGRLMILDRDTVFYFAPYLFPVYSYDASIHDIVEENEVVKDAVKVAVLGMLWGVSMSIFLYPMHIGVAIVAGFLLILAAISALCVSFIPRQLAKNKAMITTDGLLDAVAHAKLKFDDRKLPLNLEMKEMEVEVAEDLLNLAEAAASNVKKTTLEKLKEKTCLENCLSLMADFRYLKYAKDDRVTTASTSLRKRAQKKKKKKAAPKKELENQETVDVNLDSDKLTSNNNNNNLDDEENQKKQDKNNNNDEEKDDDDEDEDEDEYPLPWYQEYFNTFISKVKDYFRTAYELLPVQDQPQYLGWERHNQAPFTWLDAAYEVLFTGRGCFGMFGVEGVWYLFFMRMRATQDFSFLCPQFLEYFDEHGNDSRLVQVEETIDYPNILHRTLDIDKAVDFTYKEEARCAVHFLLLTIMSADTKLQREKVLFQKFLRENRFRLASNGIAPPKNVFSSTSYASINIPLVAIWLQTLTVDERDRFHLLKETFNAEQAQRDALIDASDQLAQQEAEQLRHWHSVRDYEYISRLDMEVTKQKEQRVNDFAEKLESFERNKFQQKRDVWVTDMDCYVDIKDQDLYERFKAACLKERNEYFEYAVNALLDCENAQRDIHLGEYGRSYQFVDSEFTPNEYSLGDSDNAQLVLGWRCAPGIRENIQLFEGGTHPDDIREGVFSNQWLLSALSMLAASSEILGNGYINERIRYLFIPHPSVINGEVTVETQVGAYCLRIYRNAEWIPVLVDDLLPMRKKDYWTNENRGIAGAHARECKGLWVSLIEKAFAKYYGSYSLLEKGFVHHALEDLTGCEATSVALSSYARGNHKRALWEQLVQFKRNGYILGAATGEANLVDKEILDMGVCFSAAYTVYDVREIDGHRLIRLRNPPGDHDEWKGDWCDQSTLWTKRLKAKMRYNNDENDNTFFMSFDDFLNVFRFLYVCKYYDPKRWLEVRHPGLWKKADEAAVEQMDLMNQFIQEQGEEGDQRPQVDQEEINRKKAKARLDSAGGLPSRFNPGCILENNPHYSLRVHRPTDVQIKVVQTPGAGRPGTNFDPVPFAILVVRNPHHEVPKRLSELKREDVLFSSGEPKKLRAQHLYISGLKPGLYMVLVGAYLAGMEGNFQINVLSNYRCEFLPVWPPAWMLKDKKKDLERQSSFSQQQMKMQENLKRGSMKAQKNVEQLGDQMRRGLQSIFGGMVEEDLDDDEEEK